jgi:hypothetical protein
VRGCLFTLLLGIVALTLLVTIGLPQVAAGALTGAVTTAGLHADDTTVTVSSDPPTDLIGLHADRVRITAMDATFRGLQIGSLDVTLTGVDLLGRTAASVDGRLGQVVIPGVASRPLTLATIRLSGGGDTITAATTVPVAQAKTLVADAVEATLGIRPTSVSLTAPDKVKVTEAGTVVHGRLSVTSSGDLVVDVLDGPAAGQQVVVLAGGQDLPIRLSSMSVTAAGALRLTGELTVGLFG